MIFALSFRSHRFSHLFQLRSWRCVWLFGPQLEIRLLGRSQTRILHGRKGLSCSQSFRYSHFPPKQSELNKETSTMERWKQIIQSRRADEVLIKPHIRTWVSVCVIEVEVDDRLRCHSNLVRNHLDQPCIMLWENVSLFLDHMLVKLLVDVWTEDWPEFGFWVWLEFVPFGFQVNGEVGNLKNWLSWSPQFWGVFLAILVHYFSC